METENFAAAANILSNQRRNQAMGDAVDGLHKTATYTGSDLQSR
jgi:hypothetical protein